MLLEWTSQHASVDTVRAFCSQRTGLADSGVGFVNMDTIKATDVIVAQTLTGRAFIGVGLPVVMKMLATEYTARFLTVLVSLQVGHVRSDCSLLTPQKVVVGTVLRIRDNGSGLLTHVVFMNSHQCR